MTDFEIFDSKGLLNRGWTDEQIASLSEDKQVILGAIIAAVNKLDVVDGGVNDTIKAQSAARNRSDAAHAAYRSVHPPVTHVDALRAVIAQQRRALLGEAPLPPEKPTKRERELLAEIEAAEADWAATTDAVRLAREEQKIARAAVGDAVMAWTGAKPPDTLQAFRDHLARQQQHKAAGNVRKVQPRINPSHLDAVLSGGGRSGHSVNYGFKRPVRGYKVPSAQ